MAVRPPYNVTPFFSPDNAFGFEQVAMVPPEVGVGSGVGVGGEGLPQLEAQQLIEQMAAPETNAPEQQQQQQQPNGGGYDPSLGVGIDRMREQAEAMMAAGRDTSAIGHPMQAVARAVQQITGAYMGTKADKREAEAAKQTQKAWRDAVGDDDDEDAMIQRMLASGDPKIVQQGLELQMQKTMARYKGKDKDGEAPKIQEFIEGGEVVQKQWDKETQQWVEVGRGSRYSPRRGGSGGSGDSGGDYGFEEGQDNNKSPLLLDDKTAEFIAEQVMAGDYRAMQLLGRGKAGAANVIKIRKLIAQKASEIDPVTGKPRMTPRQVAAAMSELQGYGAYMRTTETASANIRQAAQEARHILKDVRALSKKVPRTAYSDLNWVNNQFRSRTGDPNIAAFAAALNAFINTYSRAINPKGVPTVADKEHARDMLNAAMSQGQLEAALDVMDREMQNAIASASDARTEREDEFDSGGKNKPQPAPPMEDKSKGTTAPKAQYNDGDVKIIGGKKYVRKNGQWSPQ